MCAFQMLSVDLLMLVVLLFVIALTDAMPFEAGLTLGLAGYFALQGLLWLGQLLYFRRPGATPLSLPHYAVWFLCAGLLFLGS